MGNMNKLIDETLLSHLDVLTKQGLRHQVLKELTRLLKQNPDAAARPALARLANRNNAYVLALRILYPFIREDREKKLVASSEILNIYATSLMWIGALEEAKNCLSRIDGLTDALLTEAFVLFAQWNYQQAIPLLLRYINSTKTTDYQKLVGKINLLASLIATGQLKEARTLSDSLMKVLSQNPLYRLLYGNSLELRAQIEILENSFEAALRTLNESEKALSKQAGRYLLYVRKWRAIAEIGISNQNQTALNNLALVKQEAVQLRNWETIRDCDFHLARLTNNQELQQRILLGTPYKGYHDRIQSIFNVSLQTSRDLKYCPGNPLSQIQSIGLDLNQVSENSFFTSSSWPLIQLMTKDIYRPPRMGLVFSGLYKDEYFDPFTSPQRVRNSVFRFNEWAEACDNKFRIKVLNGDFILSGPEGVSVACTQNSRPLASWQAALKFFKSSNESRSFTSAELAKVLGITQRSASGILKKAVTSNKLQKISSGKNSRYIFFSGRRAG